MGLEADILFVATEGRDDWTGVFPEPTPRKDEGPLGSIERALELVAQRRSKGDTRPVRLVLRQGRYFLREPLQLFPVHSHLLIEAAAGESVSVSGGEKLQGWDNVQLAAASAWKAPLGTRTNPVRSLFINDRRAFRPRLPRRDEHEKDQNFFRIADVPNRTFKDEFTSGSNSFMAFPGDIPSLRFADLTEAVILNYWAESRLPIESYNASTGLICSSLRSVYLMNEEFRPRWAKYYLDNVFEAMGTPGDWFHNLEAGEIYYVPRGDETRDQLEAVIPRLERLIELRGDDEACVEDVQIRNITFEHTEWSRQLVPTDLLPHSTIPEPETLSGGPQAASHLPGAIRFVRCKRCMIEGCTIQHVGFYGIEIGEGTTDIRICRNMFYDLGGGGVKINGALFDGPVHLRTGHIEITDNTIRSVGRVFHSSVGILLMHAHDNLIAHNEVSDLFYSCISVGWTWGYAPSASYNNRIEHNHLHDYGQRWLCDMGGVYLLGVAPGTVIRGNLIHDCSSAGYGGWGVYLDEGSSHVVVEKNICYNFSGHPFNLHYGRENTLRNNLFAFGDDGVISHGRATTGQNDFSVYHNVLVTRSNIPIYRSGYQGSVSEKNFSADLNLLLAVDALSPVVASEAAWIEPAPRVLSVSDWKATGRDLGSVIATDPEQIPILKIIGAKFPSIKEIGFEAIDLAVAGPRVSESS